MDLSRRQVEIINTSTKLIGDLGLKQLTTKNLAKAMSFTEAAIYRHFSSKSDLLNTILHYYKDHMKNGLQGVLKSLSHEPGLKKVEALMNYQFQLFASEPALVKVIFAETNFQYDKVLSETVKQIMQQKSDFLKAILNEGQADGSIKKDIDPEILSSIIMGAMRITVLKWGLSNCNYNLTLEGNKTKSTLLKLIQTSTNNQL